MVHTTLRDHIAFHPDRFYKGTLFASERMLVGIDCLAPQQEQALHQHLGHDKMYYVQSGQATFTVGTETFAATPGDVIWAPADTPHSVENISDEPLIMLITMSPFPR